MEKNGRIRDRREQAADDPGRGEDNPQGGRFRGGSDGSVDADTRAKRTKIHNQWQTAKHKVWIAQRMA